MGLDRNELQRLIPALRRFSRGLTGNAVLADDLVQDCLVRALDREAQFQGRMLGPWLFAILANSHRSRFRTERARPPAEPLADIADAGSDPLMRSAIVKALTALPEDQRKALLLTALEGFSYGEVAEMLAVPVGTVMSRIHRARATLAARLGEPSIVPMRRAK